MSTSTATPVNKSNPIVGTGGIRYHAPANTEGGITLQVQPGDVFAPVSAEQSKALIESLYANVDDAWVAENAAENLVEDATAAGSAHANAEVIAYLISDNERAYDYEAQGERMLNDRREGFDLESTTGWTGPGELTTVKRLTAVDRFRSRAAEMNLMATSAEEAEDAADIVAFYRSRSEAFEDAALALSGLE